MHTLTENESARTIGGEKLSPVKTDPASDSSYTELQEYDFECSEMNENTSTEETPNQISYTHFHLTDRTLLAERINKCQVNVLLENWKNA